MPIKKFAKIWEDIEEIAKETTNELSVRSTNSDTVKLLKRVLVSFRKNYTISSEFEHLSVLVKSDTEQYFYKQWEVVVFEGSAAEIEAISGLLIPNLSYQISYLEPVENPLNYYNTGNELREIDFFEFTDSQLIFKVSVYISKPFGSGDIVVPKAKLDVVLNPFIDINQ